jgi:hypothetical protein
VTDEREAVTIIPPGENLPVSVLPTGRHVAMVEADVALSFNTGLRSQPKSM